MAEYIERKTAFDAITDLAGKAPTRSAYEAVWKSARALKKIPAADVAPVVYGRWIHSRYEDCSEQFELVKCSQCNHEAYAMAFYVRGGNYCPACGAKMDGGDNDAVG